MMKRSTELHPANKRIVELVPEHHLFQEMSDVHHLIARRAYQLFAGSGFTDGHDLEDWLRAERELLHSAPVELCESESEFVLRAELPGFQENEITVAVEPLSIIITAEHEANAGHKAVRVLYSEWRSDKIFRSVRLPRPVDPPKASIRLSNGMLEVKLPKSAGEKEERLAA